MHHMTANWCPIAPRRAQPALPRRLGDSRLDRSLARGGQHVGARRLGGPGGQLRSRDRRWSRPGSLARRVVGRRRLTAARGSRPDRRAHRLDPHDRRAVRGRGARRGVRPRAVHCSSRRERASCSTPWLEPRSTRAQRLGIESVGAYEVAMADRSEAIAIWAIPDWSTWVAYEAAWAEPGGASCPGASSCSTWARPGGGSCSSTLRWRRCGRADSLRSPTAVPSRSSRWRSRDSRP